MPVSSDRLLKLFAVAAKLQGSVTIGTTTLEPPLGFGPYCIKVFSPGRSIIYERVRDYWGAAVNVNVGRNNFDELSVAAKRLSSSTPSLHNCDTISQFRADGPIAAWSITSPLPSAKVLSFSRNPATRFVGAPQHRP
jgi:hypothetical protein